MWGNTLGWVISAIVAALTVGGVVWFEQHVSNITPTTAFVENPSNLERIELPVAPTAVLPPREQFDAGDFYREALDLFGQAPEAYDRFLAAASSAGEASYLAALEPLLKATPCSRMDLFASEPQSVITYGERPRLASIRTLGRVANRLGMLLALEDRTDDAMNYHRAAFALGARLYEERIVLEELQAGLELMSEASAAMAAMGTKIDTAEVQRYANFRAQYLIYVRAGIEPVQRVITSVDPGAIATHAGDVFHLARHSQERMWRIEAILKLGRYRFHAARIADQQAAGRAIEVHRQDPDPLIRRAASAAQQLTIEQYRMMR